jgi:hypothetical protein
MTSIGRLSLREGVMSERRNSVFFSDDIDAAINPLARMSGAASSFRSCAGSSTRVRGAGFETAGD